MKEDMWGIERGNKSFLLENEIRGMRYIYGPNSDPTLWHTPRCVCTMRCRAYRVGPSMAIHTENKNTGDITVSVCDRPTVDVYGCCSRKLGCQLGNPPFY